MWTKAPPSTGNAGNEIRFVGREKERCVRDVPGGAHFVAQRHAGVTGGRDLGPAFAAGAGARLNGQYARSYDNVDVWKSAVYFVDWCSAGYIYGVDDMQGVYQK